MVHARSEWTTRPPRSTTPYVASEVKGAAIHWLGPPASNADVPALLRGIQSFHMNTNGWSDVAYNLAVDQRGDVWVLRGLNVRSAANGNATVNRQYVAVVALLGQGQKPSADMMRGLRDAVMLVQNRYPHATAVRGHQDVSPDGTACPGPDLMAAIRAGQLGPSAPPTNGGTMPDPNLHDIEGPLSFHPVFDSAGNCTGYYFFGTTTGELHAYGPGAKFYGRSEDPTPDDE